MVLVSKTARREKEKFLKGTTGNQCFATARIGLYEGEKPAEGTNLTDSSRIVRFGEGMGPLRGLRWTRVMIKRKRCSMESEMPPIG